MSSSHLVSVIIPNFNYQRFLKQRIDTILEQTYSNIEVIILDDCSTDDSRSVIEQYRNYKQVSHIVYNEVNSGSTFKQWNKGFELAKGEYIWIAEADDYADKTLLEKTISVMSKDDSLVIGFVNSQWVMPDKMFINQDYTIPEPMRIYEGRTFVKQHLLKENYIYNASMAVFRKDALSGVGREYMSFRSCGDKLFWRNLAVQGRVLYVCEPLNYFRIHQAKVTTNSISSGLLFSEENRFFHMNIEDGFIDHKNSCDVIDYFLRYIENVKKDFISTDAYQEAKRLWLSEYDYRHKYLPWTTRLKSLIGLK